MPRPTRVLIVDDHAMVAEGMVALLETFEDVDVLGHLGSAHALLEEIQAFDADVVLLDLNMPGMNGLDATEVLLEKHPQVKVIILTMHDTPEYISTALAHGASGYLLKDVSIDEIHKALGQVMQGQRYLCATAQEAMAHAKDNKTEALTSREQTILLELAQGASNKDVGERLGISVRTVETHRKNIKRKLGISSTAGLTRYAMEHGVLQNRASGQ